ncbi:hypothetical protein HNQ93_002464 [Hymenobacter luteus]|uniref:Uncharacterized protein n=2 Tax=Hymenobacter TaxID=89966 RepID=A0A7W9WB99_9BACT|nr:MULTISPECIES: hypothetical protein [Hymenobacter]MBB4601967.1 hypothetical protein [Hymenobacter latericoloratus]MBB6059604.1 hypothetical protein [Hymenobacter luteus]
MNNITKNLTGILFAGANVALAAAPWKNKVRAIYGFNGAGTGYTVFKPTSSFNSLTQLVQDSCYIVDALTPGFELPGAVITASGGVNPASAMSLEGLYFSKVGSDEYELSFDIKYGQEFNAPGNPPCLITVDDDARFQVVASYGSQLINVYGLTPGSMHQLKAADSNGNAAVLPFTIPTTQG